MLHQTKTKRKIEVSGICYSWNFQEGKSTVWIEYWSQWTSTPLSRSSKCHQKNWINAIREVVEMVVYVMKKQGGVFVFFLPSKMGRKIVAMPFLNYWSTSIYLFWWFILFLNTIWNCGGPKHNPNEYFNIPIPNRFSEVVEMCTSNKYTLLFWRQL